MIKRTLLILVACGIIAAADSPTANLNPNCMNGKNEIISIQENIKSKELAIGRRCGQVQIIDANELSLKQTFNTINDLRSVHYFSSGNQIVAGGNWGFETIDLKSSKQSQYKGVKYAALSLLANFDDNSFFVEYRGQLKEFPPFSEGKITISSKLHPMIGADLSPDRKLIIMLGGQVSALYSITGDLKLQKPHNFDTDVYVSWCSDSSSFISYGYAKDVRIWDLSLKTNKVVTMPAETTASICGKNHIVVGDADGNLTILDRKKNAIKTLNLGAKFIFSMAFNSDESKVYIGSKGYSIETRSLDGTLIKQAKLN